MIELTKSAKTVSPDISEGGKDLRQITAPLLWAKILGNHPEVQQIILAHYYVGGRKVRTFRYSVNEVAEELSSGKYPFKDGLSVDGIPLMCSISSIVGTSETSNKHLIRTKKNPNKYLRLTDPKSFVNFDFSCDVNSGSLDLIVDTLCSYPFNWYVLRTGKSYHAVLDTLVELHKLPLIWSDALRKFSRQSSSSFVRQNGSEIGSLLASCSPSITALRLGVSTHINQVFNEITSSQGGFEKFSETSILDWGHIAYSLRELLLFYEGRVPGTSYLRIGPKGESPTPLVIAQKVDGIVAKFDPGNYFQLQPYLL